MPNIIVPSDLTVGEIKVPNAVSGNAGEGVNADLAAIITKHEKELLLRALGYSQYSELQTALADLPGAAQKWQDLVNGNGAWQGLKRILKNYIYCSYLRFDEVTYTTTGAGKAKVVGHSATDYNQKYVERWNEFVCWYQDGNEEDTSLYQFLVDTAGLEVDKFQWFKYENSFGL